MDYIIIENFFKKYSLPAVIIAIGVSAILIILRCVLKDKINRFYKTQTPFFISVFLYVVFDMIFIAKDFYISSQAIYSGVLSGSLSGVIVSIAKRIIEGRPVVISATALLIESFLEGYISDDELFVTAMQIEAHFKVECSDQEMVDKVISTLKNSSAEFESDEHIHQTASLIIHAVKLFDQN